jgi:hypothetical protein
VISLHIMWVATSPVLPRDRAHTEPADALGRYNFVAKTETRAAKLPQ